MVQRCVTVTQIVHCMAVTETFFIQLCGIHIFSLLPDFITTANTIRLSSKIFSFVFHLLCIPFLIELYVIMDTVVLIPLTVADMKMLNNQWKDQGKVRKDRENKHTYRMECLREDGKKWRRC